MGSLLIGFCFLRDLSKMLIKCGCIFVGFGVLAKQFCNKFKYLLVGIVLEWGTENISVIPAGKQAQLFHVLSRESLKA